MINNIETQQFKMMMQAIKERDEAVNERQRLIDSNRELLERVKEIKRIANISGNVTDILDVCNEILAGNIGREIPSTK